MVAPPLDDRPAAASSDLPAGAGAAGAGAGGGGLADATAAAIEASVTEPGSLMT